MSSWPGGARLAVWVGVGTGDGHGPSASYALRAGFGAVLDRLGQLALPPAVLLDTALAASAPHLVEAARAAGAELVGHRDGATGALTDLQRSDERTHLRAVAARLRSLDAATPGGWASPGRLRTAHTLDLLVEVGYRYLLDLHLDDRPVRLAALGGSLLALPSSPDLDAAVACGVRGTSAADFADAVVDEFDELCERAERPADDDEDDDDGGGDEVGVEVGGPLVMGVVLDPATTGSPGALRRVTRALRHVVASTAASEGRVLFTQPRALAEAVARHPALAAAGRVRL